MNASWYDLLDVAPTATADEIRAAWRAAVADLDPTDRRFRVFNQAAEVLLDPGRRAAYDAELAAAEPEPEPESREAGPEPAAAGTGSRDEQRPVPLEALTLDTAAPVAQEQVADEQAEDERSRTLPLVPGWALIAVAVVLAASLTIVGVLWSKPADSAVDSDTQAAQSAAERAIVPLLSYDAHHLDQSQAAATPYMTDNERQQYDKLFSVIRDNAPRTGTVVKAKYLASGIVRSGTDRVSVLVFVNQVTYNKQHPKTPVVYKNQVTVTMAKQGGQWLVDDLTTNNA